MLYKVHVVRYPYVSFTERQRKYMGASMMRAQRLTAINIYDFPAVRLPLLPSP